MMTIDCRLRGSSLNWKNFTNIKNLEKVITVPLKKKATGRKGQVIVFFWTEIVVAFIKCKTNYSDWIQLFLYQIFQCRSQYNMLCWVFFDCTWLSLFYISSCSRWCCERTLISVIFLFKINNFQVTFMFQKYRYECTLITLRFFKYSPTISLHYILTSLNPPPPPVTNEYPGGCVKWNIVKD